MTKISSMGAATQVTNGADSCEAAGHVELDTARERSDALYRRYGRNVSQICRSLLRDRSEAEDATQQVFLSVHRALLRGTVPREPAAWVATIARNECRARIRARMSTPLAESTDSVDRVSPDPPAEAIRRAEVAAFWLALADLPRAQRDALLLREIRGLSYDQVAEQLSISHPSVRSLLNRGRQRIRFRLRDIHSALGGISWLETLARLFTGGSSPVAPVAAKAVAVGLGAAALTGGAVVAPEMFDHHVRPVTVPRVMPRVARHSPSVHAARRATTSAVPGTLRSGGAGDRHTQPGRSPRVRDDGELAQPSESGHRSRDGTTTTNDGGSSGRDGSDSGGGLSRASATGEGSSVFSSGDSGSSGSNDSGGDSGVSSESVSGESGD